MAHSGNVCKSQINGARNGNTPKRTAKEMTATPIPALIISVDGIEHGAAAIAFGGDDTGKQYANEQHNAAGIIKYSGWTLATRAISAKTGNITLATATLLEN